MICKKAWPCCQSAYSDSPTLQLQPNNELKGGWCDLSRCVWRYPPGNNNRPCASDRKYQTIREPKRVAGGLLGPCHEVALYHRLPDSRWRTTASWFGIFFQMAPVCLSPPTPRQELRMWDQFHLSPHFPATELSAFSDCLKLWHEELLRWPHYSLLDVSEGVVPCGCLR